ncbi:MAG TPA: hypothetical protein PLI27_07060 [Ignavibacteriales bacterium]|nr:hypothetical protein [Ignavibacteriales bacterium]HOL81561.1 hypothetical protein [Ignavibacteriales bacterium]HOM65609.1 hypothetical protein [Ignavibacteriales bacterium]HPD67817.1 hypothetical protein [Ignavibacteriales bacterium]HPP33675.1 hypothetical protein [Ignavibacteriales bacterium]
MNIASNIRELINSVTEATKNLITENKQLKQKLYETQKMINDLQVTTTKYHQVKEDQNKVIEQLRKEIEELKYQKALKEQELTNLHAEFTGLKLELENFKKNSFVISEEERKIVKSQLQQVIQEIDKLVE